MTVWIVLSIIAVVLSPLVWLKPSRGQSGRMAIRMAARRMGLAMQLIPQDWPHWMPGPPPSPCAQYHRPRRSAVPEAWVYWQPEPGVWVDQWRDICAEPPLLARLRELPADVFKVEAGRQVIALYWAEGGQPEILQRVAKTLEALA